MWFPTRLLNSGAARLTINRMCTTTVIAAAICSAQTRDPGIRGGSPGAGGPLPGLTAEELAAFTGGLAAFQEVDDVGKGLGPRFNLDSCSGCHAFPVVGGTSPALNPQIAMANKMGATNVIPSFITVYS